MVQRSNAINNNDFWTIQKNLITVFPVAHGSKVGLSQQHKNIDVLLQLTFARSKIPRA